MCSANPKCWLHLIDSCVTIYQRLNLTDLKFLNLLFLDLQMNLEDNSIGTWIVNYTDCNNPENDNL